MEYIYSERKQFTTLGELRKLTENLADDTVVTICGSGEQDSFIFRRTEN